MLTSQECDPSLTTCLGLCENEGNHTTHLPVLRPGLVQSTEEFSLVDAGSSEIDALRVELVLSPRPRERDVRLSSRCDGVSASPRCTT